MIKMRVLAARRRRNDIADLYLLVGHDHPINEQFHQLPLLLERRLLQPGRHALAKSLHVFQHLLDLLLPIDLQFQLAGLLPEPFDARVQVAAPPPVFL